MTLLRRRGLLDDLDEAVFERILGAAVGTLKAVFQRSNGFGSFMSFKRSSTRPRSTSFDGLFSSIAAGLEQPTARQNAPSLRQDDLDRDPRHLWPHRRSRSKA
jgi:hypothetical protein